MEKNKKTVSIWWLGAIFVIITMSVITMNAKSMLLGFMLGPVVFGAGMGFFSDKKLINGLSELRLHILSFSFLLLALMLTSFLQVNYDWHALSDGNSPILFYDSPTKIFLAIMMPGVLYVFGYILHFGMDEEEKEITES